MFISLLAFPIFPYMLLHSAYSSPCQTSHGSCIFNILPSQLRPGFSLANITQLPPVLSRPTWGDSPGTCCLTLMTLWIPEDKSTTLESSMPPKPLAHGPHCLVSLPAWAGLWGPFDYISISFCALKHLFPRRKQLRRLSLSTGWKLIWVDVCPELTFSIVLEKCRPSLDASNFLTIAASLSTRLGWNILLSSPVLLTKLYIFSCPANTFSL